jgi:hypothetical protein
VAVDVDAFELGTLAATKSLDAMPETGYKPPMKTYRMVLRLSLVEFDEPDPPSIQSETQESADPVKRDMKELSVTEMAKAWRKEFPEIGGQRQALHQTPSTFINTDNAYLIRAGTLQEGVAILERFSSLAEEIGTLTTEPMPMTIVMPSIYR